MRFLLLSILVFNAMSVWASETELEWSDSGIRGRPYREILMSMEVWKEKYPNLVEIQDYGTTKNGHILRLAVVKKKLKTDRRTALLMTGSTHGNEFLNIEDRLPEEILELADKPGSISRYLDSGGAFVFVPILNPDGYEGRIRENANNKDLNRDWDVPEAGFQGFTQVETRNLSQALQKMAQSPYGFEYQVTVDYHCCIGALLHPWSYDPSIPLAEKDATEYSRLGQLTRDVLDIQVGSTGEVLGYRPMGTTKDYYYSKYGSLAFTYEGRYRLENKLLDKHIEWWKRLVDYTVPAGLLNRLRLGFQTL